MVYTDSMKRRDTKLKWKRRIRLALESVDEIDELRDKYYLRPSIDKKTKAAIGAHLFALTECYRDVANEYAWMLENLSGG